MRTRTAMFAALLVVSSLLVRADDDDEAIVLLKAKPDGAKPAPAEAAANPAPPKSRFGPMDVEVRLSDGSAIRGEIKGIDTVRLKTNYGSLAFPAARIMRVTRGQRLTPDETKTFQDTLKLLDADTFQRRAAAQQKLEEMGPPVLAALKQARAVASLEARNRIDAVMKKIEAKGLPRPQTEDVVQADDFAAPGRLELDAFTLKSKVGELSVKFDDIESIRWLCRGSMSAFDLEAVAGLEDWHDTGVDAIASAVLAVQCSGTIQLNNQPTTPIGNTNWGNGNPFIAGSVVGRMGQGGQPFLIANGKRWTAESGERLYVKIFWPQKFQRQDNRYTGHYSFRVATGAWADDLPAQPAAAGGNENQ